MLSYSNRKRNAIQTQLHSSHLVLVEYIQYQVNKTNYSTNISTVDRLTQKVSTSIIVTEFYPYTSLAVLSATS